MAILMEVVKEYIKELSLADREANRDVTVEFSQNRMRRLSRKSMGIGVHFCYSE